MRNSWLCLLAILFFSSLKADESLISLDEFIKQIQENITFVYPITKQETTPAYSIISLVLKDKSNKIKPLSEIHERAIDGFIGWINIIIKKQYCYKDITKEIIALPDVVLFENKTQNNKPVFSWVSDILLVRNNTQKESYSWDTGTFFVLYLKTTSNNFENKNQVRAHIETLLSQYTNFFSQDHSLYTFEATKKDGIWKGIYSHPQQNYYSWRRFTEFIIGNNFTCFFFAEIADGITPSLRATPGDVNRF